MDSIAKINRFLAERGMSGAQLEKAIGVSHSVYSQWNTRRTKPSSKSLKKISEVLGVSVFDLQEDQEEVTAAFHDAELTQEEEDELWRKAREFYNYLRDRKLMEKRNKK